MKTDMKRSVMILLLCMLVLLSACGAAETQSGKPTEAPASQTQPPETEKPAPTAPAAAPEPTAAPTEAPAAETPPAETEEPAPIDEMLETAKTFIGKTTPELFEAIGKPESSDYAPSCLGPGEDGNLYYENFTVYTYRENLVETIRIVE
jgi:hypothetical protein